MKTIRHILTLAFFLWMAQIAPAAVPSAINYQGRLTNAAGVPQPGVKAMSLKIYDAATAGTLLYSESVGNVTIDTNGVYGFQFGASGAGTPPSISTALVASVEQWLELTVDGVVQAPRQKILAVPFSLMAGALPDGAVSSSMIAEGAVSLSKITGLGTAATVNTGTTAGTIPVLETGGKLPVLDGSLLNNVNTTQTTVALGTVTTSATISLAAGTNIAATLTASTLCTFTMPAVTAGKSFTLQLKQAPSYGNGTAVFTDVKWGTVGAPTVTATENYVDLFTFTSDGANWYGTASQGYNPFSRVTEVAAYGDSITDQSYYDAGSPNIMQQFMTSYMWWAQAYSGNRFELMSRGTLGASKTDFGYSGAKIADLANGATFSSVQPMAVILAKSPRVVVELSGANDVVLYYGNTAARISTARIANWDYLLSHGVQRIVAIGILPLRTGSFTSEQVTLADATNTLLQAAALSRNVTWVPYPAVFKSGGLVASNYFRDDLHPNHLGAQVLGQAVATALLPYVQATDYTVPADGSARWVTGNPYQSGTVSANGGQAATGWEQWFGYSGIVPSKVIDTLTWQRLTITGQTSNTNGATGPGIWHYTAASSSVASGTMVRAVARIRTSSASFRGFQLINVQNETNRPTGIMSGTGFALTNNYPTSINDFDLTFLGPRIPMTTTTSTNLWFYAYGNGAIDLATCGVITVP